MVLVHRPTLTFEEAEKIGLHLCTRFSVITGRKPPIIKDEAWADLVQAVMRWAGDAIEKRELAKGKGDADVV